MLLGLSAGTEDRAKARTTVWLDSASRCIPHSVCSAVFTALLLQWLRNGAP